MLWTRAHCFKRKGKKCEGVDKKLTMQWLELYACNLHPWSPLCCLWDPVKQGRKGWEARQMGGTTSAKEPPSNPRNRTKEAKVDLGRPWTFPGSPYKFDFTAQGVKERQLWGQKCFSCKISSSTFWKPGSWWQIKGIAHLGLSLNTEWTVRSHLANPQLQADSTPVKGAPRIDPQRCSASRPNMWLSWCQAVLLWASQVSSHKTSDCLTFSH